MAHRGAVAADSDRGLWLSTPLSPQAAQLYAIRNNFETYATTCLKIADKGGRIIDFMMNRGQRYLHARIEDQIKRTGKVRMLVLKGRQQGVSTYIGGRFYWKASGEFGKHFKILTHLDEATQNLFDMVKRYHDSMPLALKPKVKNDNAKQLSFEGLKTKYSVSTAGSRGTGRSATAQYFHGSETGFWPNAEKHMAGIGQIVPMEDGTEVIFESTANGIGNLFHRMCMEAIKGRGDFELCFIPWFWQEEYRRTVPDGIEWEPEELEYQEAFSVDDDQMYWRRLKITDEFSDDHTMFDQEYPATIEMAFMGGSSKALINPIGVAAAVARSKARDDDETQALIMGVDPAEYGDDDTAIVIRRGRKVLYTKRYSKEGNAQIAGRVSLLLKEWEEKGDPIDAVCVDVTGVGTGVEAFLSDAGHTNVYRIHNGESAIEDEKYRNRGAECWGRMSEWVKDKERPASLPADAVLQAEMSARSFTYDSRRRVVIQSKEEMRRLGIMSPNTADALALTFAVTLKPRGSRKRRETLEDKLRRIAHRTGQGGSPGMAA